MKRAQAIVTTPARHRWELALGTVIIPLLAAVLLLLAWLLLDQFPDGPNGWSADTAVAMTAAVIGSSLTLWWAGGLVMVGVGALARKLRWSRVEGWARKLTPALMARTLGAVVGIHVVTFSSAHAAETPNPFWSGSESSVSQSQDSAPDGAGHSSNDAPDGADNQSPPISTEASPTDPSKPEAAPQHDPHHNVCAHERCATVPGPARVTDASLTVVAGDTLWDLTAQFLGPDASNSHIAEQTATWSEHNALPHGPDLIFPGQQLRVPPQLLAGTAATPTTEGATS